MRIGLFNYYVITFTSAAIIVLLAVLMWSIKIPTENTVWSRMRHARKYLTTSYLIIGILGPFLVFIGGTFSDNVKMFSTAISLESNQVMMLTAALVSLITDNITNGKWVAVQSIPMLLTILMQAVAIHVVPPEYTLATSYISSAIYAAQIAASCLIFRSHYRTHLQNLNRQQIHYKPERIKKTFIYIMIMGAMALLTDIAILNIEDIHIARLLLTIFIMTYTIFYAYIQNRFYNYIYTAHTLSGKEDNENTAPETAEAAAMNDNDGSVEKAAPAQQEIPEKDIEFGKVLAKWVEEKKYLNKDITIEDVTEQLDTSKKYIYYYFRTYMNTNFRTWRTELRIKEAQQILTENPDMSLEKVADMTGFNHRANFFQQFQKITGMSPTEYKKQ